jgi:hypothetical protein
VPPGDGFTHLGHGAWVNGEKIWHAKFTISLAAAKMQFSLNASLSGVDVEANCKAAAIQWAAAIEDGQPPDKVVPGNVIGAIIGGARRGVYAADEHKYRLAKTASGQPRRSF